MFRKVPNRTTNRAVLGKEPNVTYHKVPAAYTTDPDNRRTDKDNIFAQGHATKKPTHRSRFSGDRPSDPDVLYALMCEDVELCLEM